jgi:hypothetical protein
MIENQTIDLDYLKRRIRLYKAELRVKPLLRTMISDLKTGDTTTSSRWGGYSTRSREEPIKKRGGRKPHR